MAMRCDFDSGSDSDSDSMMTMTMSISKYQTFIGRKRDERMHQFHEFVALSIERSFSFRLPAAAPRPESMRCAVCNDDDFPISINYTRLASLTDIDLDLMFYVF